MQTGLAAQTHEGLVFFRGSLRTCVQVKSGNCRFHHGCGDLGTTPTKIAVPSTSPETTAPEKVKFRPPSPGRARLPSEAGSFSSLQCDSMVQHMIAESCTCSGCSPSSLRRLRRVSVYRTRRIRIQESCEPKLHGDIAFAFVAVWKGEHLDKVGKKFCRGGSRKLGKSVSKSLSCTFSTHKIS
jgi:hypothetical protein